MSSKAIPTGAALRAACRTGEFALPTPGHAPGCVQANLVILPEAYAKQFAHFCASNPAPCPLLEKTEPGIFEARNLAPGSDIRKDIPKYIVWRDGKPVEEVTDVTDLCDGDMQGFLLGCSFTWEDILAAAGLVPRHIEENCNVPMFNTSLPLDGKGSFPSWHIYTF